LKARSRSFRRPIEFYPELLNRLRCEAKGQEGKDDKGAGPFKAAISDEKQRDQDAKSDSARDGGDIPDQFPADGNDPDARRDLLTIKRTRKTWRALTHSTRMLRRLSAGIVRGSTLADIMKSKID
jgi:hypothetical protein